MTRQCSGCAAALHEEGRSPRCPRCRAERVREQNLAKVHDFRQRRRDYQPTLGVASGAHLPYEKEIEWLDGLNLGLAEPVWDLCEAIRRGRAPYHEEVLGHARIALDRYDGLRAEFEARVLLHPDPLELSEEWRGFFEQLREAVQ